jgi:hypothetical protein
MVAGNTALAVIQNAALEAQADAAAAPWPATAIS